MGSPGMSSFKHQYKRNDKVTIVTNTSEGPVEVPAYVLVDLNGECLFVKPVGGPDAATHQVIRYRVSFVSWNRRITLQDDGIT